MEPLLTTTDVARRLNVGIDTVYSFIREDGLPAMKLKGQWRFYGSEVQQWVEECRHTPLASRENA